MGLVKVFEAADLIEYDRFWLPLGAEGAAAACHPDPATGGTIPEVVQGTDSLYYQGNRAFLPSFLPCVRYETPPLGTPPLGRMYGEEIVTPGGLVRPGAVWGTADPTEEGPGEIRFLALVEKVVWPSWDVNLWRFTSATGKRRGKTTIGNLGSVMASGGKFFVERTGAVWVYDSHVLVDSLGAAIVSPDSAWPTGGAVLPGDFAGHATDAILDFAIDRVADRVWIRWAFGPLGCVKVYRLSTREELAAIYTPNETNGIALTHDGCVYVFDVLEWICLYDYEGRLRGAMRAPRSNANLYGAAYGWDPVYKRLLRVVNTPCASTGASTLRIEGYAPVPEAAILSPPIPRQVPRKGRTIYVLAQACGEGAEAMIGLPASATVGASTVAEGGTDPEGDAVLAYTPAATGPLTMGISV